MNEEGFVKKPNRECDGDMGFLEFYYIEGFVFNLLDGHAGKISVKDGRVCIYDKSGWLDMGDIPAIIFMNWLFAGNGLSLKHT